jgi:hypothetical protein
MSLFNSTGASQTVGPASGGKVTPINNVTTTAAQVLGANPSRVSVTFHNPGSNTLYVGPTTNAFGAAFTPTLSALGGMVQLFGGALWTFTGECQTPFQALAAAGSTNPLTIIESNI